MGRRLIMGAFFCARSFSPSAQYAAAPRFGLRPIRAAIVCRHLARVMSLCQPIACVHWPREGTSTIYEGCSLGGCFKSCLDLKCDNEDFVLSTTCGRGIARLREGLYNLRKVYRTCARSHLQPVEGLSHVCKMASTTCGRSIARVREVIYNLWKVYRTCARSHLQPVEGLSHGCEKASTTCGRSIARLREGLYNLRKVYRTCARSHLQPVEGVSHGFEKASTTCGRGIAWVQEGLYNRGCFKSCLDLKCDNEDFVLCDNLSGWLYN